jgi:hypothetical protein
MVDAETIPVPAHEAEALRRVYVRIEPEALYTAEEAALIIGVRGSKASRQNHMYSIPQDRLARIRVGPTGGRWRWRGADLLRYRRNGGRTP